jgi:hypothetical protein
MLQDLQMIMTQMKVLNVLGCEPHLNFTFRWLGLRVAAMTSYAVANL